MIIKIERKITNRLYTEGKIIVNGKPIANTEENTCTMLPGGIYHIQLRYAAEHERYIAILAEPLKGMLHVPNTLSKIYASGSYLNARKHNVICIGEPLIPGALTKGGKILSRLIDRIEKAEARHEAVSLIISDDDVRSVAPARHWFESSKHELV